MNTVSTMGPYRDLLFYGFVAGVIHLTIAIHSLIYRIKNKKK